MGRSWGREEVAACLIPPHPSRESCLINWAMQTHNYITFLNNRHFLPGVLLSFFCSISARVQRGSSLEIKAADSALSPSSPGPPIALLVSRYFFFTFSHSANSVTSRQSLIFKELLRGPSWRFLRWSVVVERLARWWRICLSP